MESLRILSKASITTITVGRETAATAITRDLENKSHIVFLPFPS